MWEIVTVCISEKFQKKHEKIPRKKVAVLQKHGNKNSLSDKWAVSCSSSLPLTVVIITFKKNIMEYFTQ